ncbi:6524_t:CDS:10 [Paraglomus occultum]|uniref:6524_t:CDS:1 n=1 Tax=Paraglomus occultum TaxID=144539 RepID=A0A9N9BT63_9GLOM|nr:6524_t:CDS:10 [Paraglomus occultum]
MSGRAYRKALKDKELQAERGSSSNLDFEELDAERNEPAKNLFDLLNEEEENNNDEERSAEEELKDEDSKGEARDQTTTRTNQIDEMSVGELERAIREITKELGPQSSNSVKTNKSKKAKSDFPRDNSNISLLTVDTKMLDADAEMRRMFGSAVVDREIRGRNYSRTAKRMLLARPRDSWPPIDRVGYGLSMEFVEEKNGVQYFKINHSQKYRSIQELFLDCIASHDPNTIAALVRDNPYHIDSLLQLSDICKMSGDHGVAGEMVERALYAFEKCFHPEFYISKGTVRLDYKHFENRAFFLALFRHAMFLSRRGCWQTAFGFTRLLLALSPESDPLSALLFIDFFGLKTRQYSYVYTMANEWKAKKLYRYPNFAYSRALAKFHLELQDDKDSANEESSALLKLAIIYFPGIVLGLAKKCDIILGSDIVSHAYFQPLEDKSYLSLLYDLYIEQTSSLWAQSEVASWLTTTLVSLMSELSEHVSEQEGGNQLVIFIPSHTSSGQIEVGECIRESFYNAGVPQNVCRFVIVSENNNLRGHLPPEISAMEIMLYDPLPPTDGDNQYDRYVMGSSSGARTHRWQNFLVAQLRRLLNGAPNADLNRLAERLNNHIIEDEELFFDPPMDGIIDPEARFGVPGAFPDVLPGAFPGDLASSFPAEIPDDFLDDAFPDELQVYLLRKT